MGAGRKIFHSEGFKGLYRGFFVSAFQVVSGVCYVSTYESVRHILDKQGIVTDNKIKAFVGGGCASIVGQTIIVPFDVISQHLMLLGQLSGKTKLTPEVKASVNPFNIHVEGVSKAKIAAEVTKNIYRRDGFRGFYRGFTTSLATYVPSTAVQCAAAMSAGCASCVLTNPLALIRTRVQVQRRHIPETVKHLWRTEGIKIFSKGLTARLTSSIIYSIAIILGYETVKKWSVHEEYKPMVKW